LQPYPQQFFSPTSQQQQQLQRDSTTNFSAKPPPAQLLRVAIFRSRNVAKYTVGSDFKGGRLEAIQKDKDGGGGLVVSVLPEEAPGQGGEECMGYLLKSSNPGKYESGKTFNNGSVRGTVVLVDTSQSLILVRKSRS
jgi:hypothetical protein